MWDMHMGILTVPYRVLEQIHWRYGLQEEALELKNGCTEQVLVPYRISGVDSSEKNCFGDKFNGVTR